MAERKSKTFYIFIIFSKTIRSNETKLDGMFVFLVQIQVKSNRKEPNMLTNWFINAPYVFDATIM